MATTITATTDEAQIRERLESWTKAVRDKDLDFPLLQPAPAKPASTRQ